MTVNIGEKIRKVISDAGFSQTDLAKCLGVTPQQVSHWINNKGFPSLDKFISLIEVTGKDANFFLGFPSRIGHTNQIVGSNNQNIHQTINPSLELLEIRKDIAEIKRILKKR
ncbi:MAG: helix-turn-helix transcriptional regulator [Elusimicrobiaceae bacterium]|nr:helix-turn-helix transcriptional regulator [Elusimicrobiaceae bacterium]